MDARKIRFSLTDVAELLIQKAGLTHGKWILGLTVTTGAGTLTGKDPYQQNPYVSVSVDEIYLEEKATTDEVSTLLRDAAVVAAKNPRPTPVVRLVP